MLEAERHAVDLAANSVRWALQPEQLQGTHPGVRAHLTAARVQLEAVRSLLEEKMP